MVVKDYVSRLSTALWNARAVSADMAGLLLNKRTTTEAPKLINSLVRKQATEYAEQKTLELSKSPQIVTVFNPLPHVHSRLIELRISGSSRVRVTDSRGKTVPSEVYPYFESATELSPTQFTLVFVSELASLGLEAFSVQIDDNADSGYPDCSVYALERHNADESYPIPMDWRTSTPEKHRLTNKHVTVEFDQNAMLQSVTAGDNTVSITQTFNTYGSNGGAYIFQPLNAGTAIQTTPTAIRVCKGKLMSQLDVEYVGVAVLAQRFRLLHEGTLAQPMLDMSFTVDLTTGYNEEVFVRFETGV